MSIDKVQAVREFVGARVRASRQAHGWTAKALGQLIGKSEATVSRIERGKQRLGVDDITAIAALLDLEPGDLLPCSRPEHAGPSPVTRVSAIVTALHAHVQAQSLLLTEASTLLEGPHASSHHRVYYGGLSQVFPSARLWHRLAYNSLNNNILVY